MTDWNAAESRHLLIMGALERMDNWQPIETAPLDKWLLLWWTPKGASNPYAEACVIGQVSSHRPGKYWDGRFTDDLGEEGYKDLERILYWMPLPPRPASRPLPDTLRR